jgi:HSP20 family molecular chaperone IbpA
MHSDNKDKGNHDIFDLNNQNAKINRVLRLLDLFVYAYINDVDLKEIDYNILFPDEPGNSPKPARHKLIRDLIDRSYFNLDDQQSFEESEENIDLMDDEKTLSITIALPGAGQEDIFIVVNNYSVEIKAASSSEVYHEIFELPFRVKKDSAKITYQNGVLDVELLKD